MIRIDGKEYNGQIRYFNGDMGANVEAVIMFSKPYTEADIDKLKSASFAEVIVNKQGNDTDITESYILFGWTSVRKRGETSIIISWQTYRDTDISEIKSEGEDLAEAVMELAELVSQLVEGQEGSAE